jgi:hypothetical protein
VATAAVAAEVEEVVERSTFRCCCSCSHLRPHAERETDLTGLRGEDAKRALGRATTLAALTHFTAWFFDHGENPTKPEDGFAGT